ncbi:MAG: tetratricopeptide repeat protein [Planctomycetota bacterium]
MNTKLLFFTSLPLLVLSLVGCRSLNKDAEQNFIEPLATTTSDVDRGSMPKNERELCVRTAETVAEKGHFTEAIALYEKAERLDPQAGLFNRELAPLFAQSKNFDQSLARYRAAIAEAPQDAELANNYVWTLLEARKTTQAASVVESAIARFPGDQRLATTKAIVLYRQGDRAGALEQFKSLDGLSAAHHNLAMLDIESGDETAAKNAVAVALAASPSPQTIELAQALGLQGSVSRR